MVGSQGPAAKGVVNHPLIIRPEAENDLTAAYGWYEGQREGLGLEYLLCVEAVVGAIGRHPLAHPLVHRNVRRALVRRFPYGVFCFLDDTTVVVVAVFHCRRDPSSWQERV